MYTRRGCGLCEDMVLDLEEAGRRWPHQLELVDIDSDAALVAAHGDRIPVLVHAGRELCFGHLDLDALADAAVKNRQP